MGCRTPAEGHRVSMDPSGNATSFTFSRPSTRLETAGWASSIFRCRWMSFQMMNLLKERFPRNTSSSMSQPRLSITARRMAFITRRTATCPSFSGSLSSPGMQIPCCCRSISSSVRFATMSSPVHLMLQVALVISTGIRRIGAKCGVAPSSSSHFRAPAVKYSVLAPFSSR